MGATEGRNVVFSKGRYNGLTIQEWLPYIANQIVEDFRPHQIIVFGSLARRETGEDSDIDLLIVLPKVTDKHETAVNIGTALARFPVPVDIIVADPPEVEARRGELGSVLATALEGGEVLYDDREPSRQ